MISNFTNHYRNSAEKSHFCLPNSFFLSLFFSSIKHLSGNISSCFSSVLSGTCQYLKNTWQAFYWQKKHGSLFLSSCFFVVVPGDPRDQEGDRLHGEGV